MLNLSALASYGLIFIIQYRICGLSPSKTWVNKVWNCLWAFLKNFHMSFETQYQILTTIEYFRIKIEFCSNSINNIIFVINQTELLNFYTNIINLKNKKVTFYWGQFFYFQLCDDNKWYFFLSLEWFVYRWLCKSM